MSCTRRLSSLYLVLYLSCCHDVNILGDVKIGLHFVFTFAHFSLFVNEGKGRRVCNTRKRGTLRCKKWLTLFGLKRTFFFI